MVRKRSARSSPISLFSRKSEGGMGAAGKACDTRLDRIVATKLGFNRRKSFGDVVVPREIFFVRQRPEQAHSR